MAANPEQAAVAPAVETRPAGVKAPYVGLRPFDRSEREIFFGRDRDAQFLSDKIFSARLTLLYAKSGVGKSSILRTLVIPEIERQHARVVYFDACGGAEPYELLRANLIELASKIGIPDAGVGAPTLSELVRLVTSTDDQTLVLILDQFEEFLIAHGHRLDPLRRELAALVRASEVDVRIVLSLRQEFLAGLEPFRYEMLNLFQSTYLLDSLDDKGIRDAIEKPARRFGKTYEPGLVDRLVADLRAQESSEPASPASVPIDLPMLQLVCSQLWEAASKREISTLSLDLYKEMGGAEKILNGYVRDVMPHRWSEQRLTARLMKHLAPSSGFKRSYSVGDLAETENLDADRVQAELQRLGKHRILQPREFRGQQLWELQHDAFIRMIAPWRDNVLRRAKQQRRIVTVLVGCFVIAAVAIGLLRPIIKGRLEIYSNTEAPLSELKNMSAADRSRLAEMRFDTATAYLLEKGRMDLLSSLLKKYADDLPDDYGLSSSESQDAGISSEETPCESLCVHYSSARPIDSRYFDQTWRFWARAFAEKQGIPVPPRLRLITEPSYPKSLIRFTEGSRTLLAFRTPPYDQEKEVFITSENLQAPDGKRLQVFLDGCAKECRKIERSNDANVALWAVPRWSRPIWKVAGRPATDESGLPALLLALKLQQDPTPLFTDYAFKLLKERAQQEYPQTLSEAVASRGSRLKRDMIELVKLGIPLTDPVSVLDALAAYPEADSKQAAEHARRDLNEQSVPMLTAGNSNQAGIPPDEAVPNGIINGYQGAADYLPPIGRTIQIYLGRELASLWISKDTNELIPEIVGSVSGLRADFFRQFGVRLPPVYFNPSSVGPTLPTMAFRIEIPNRAYTPSSSEVVQVDRATAIARLVPALNSAATKARDQWILSEDASEQRQRVEPGFRHWLEQRYSLTHQKLLLRALISPTAGKEEPAGLPTEKTLRHEDWLLGSLVFWSLVDDARNGVQMVEDLRRTQRARLNPVGVEDMALAVAPEISRGIRALEAGRIPEAEGTFSNATRINRSAAIQLFLARYPNSLRTMELQEFERACSTQTQDSRYMWPMDLEEVLFGSHNNMALGQEMELGLCLVRAYDTGLHKKQAAIEAELLRQYPKPDDWPTSDARWVALKILNDFDPFTDPASLRDGAAELLKSAMRRANPEGSRSLLQEFAKTLKRPGPKQWRWKLLKDLAGVRPEILIQFDLALQLASRDNPEDLQESLGLVQQVEQTVKQIPNSAESRKMLDLCRYLQAVVLIQSSGLGLSDRGAEAETILQGLQNSGFLSINSQIIELRLRQGRYVEAIASLTTVLKQSPEDSGLYLQMFLAQLLSGDKEAAAATASTALQRADQLEQESRDQQLCRRYLREMIRAALAKDNATLNDAAKRFNNIKERLSKAYQARLSGYLSAVLKENSKNADAAWQSMEDLEQETRDSLSGMLFVASLGEMIANGEAAKAEESTRVEETVRRFLETDHEYVPYIAMILYTRTSGAAQQEAREVIEHRWKKIDRNRLAKRLQGGDETAWREILIGYYLKQVTRDEIFGQLEDEKVYDKSDFRAVPMPRQGLLCEAYFYDALLAAVEHDQARRDSDLQQVLDTKVYGYIEYDLAKFLLADAKHRY